MPLVTYLCDLCEEAFQLFNISPIFSIRDFFPPPVFRINRVCTLRFFSVDTPEEMSYHIPPTPPLSAFFVHIVQHHLEKGL